MNPDQTAPGSKLLALSTTKNICHARIQAFLSRVGAGPGSTDTF